MSLPRIVKVHETKEGEEKYLIASRNNEEAMSDTDGPRLVGTYRLFGTQVLRKNVVATKGRTVR